MNPLISVLIPMYNSQDYIEDCLNSILKQTYSNFEIIVMDDGSIDKSNEIVKEIANKDNRIKLYRKENEKSVSKTRNSLLEKITGEYFIFVDSDDTVSPFYLQHLVTCLKETETDIACCNFTVRKKGFSKNKKLKKKYMLNRDDAIKEMILGKDGHFMVWNKLIKTSLIENVKFDDDLSYGEDFVFVFNLLQNDVKVSFLKNKLYYYRLRKGSLSGNGVNANKKKFLDRMLEMEKNNKYDNDKSILSSWIYITSALYLVLIRFKSNGREHRQEFKTIMKDHYKEYKQNKNIRKIYRVLMSFIKTFERVKVR